MYMAECLFARAKGVVIGGGEHRRASLFGVVDTSRHGRRLLSLRRMRGREALALDRVAYERHTSSWV